MGRWDSVKFKNRRRETNGRVEMLLENKYGQWGYKGREEETNKVDFKE